MQMSDFFVETMGSPFIELSEQDFKDLQMGSRISVAINN